MSKIEIARTIKIDGTIRLKLCVIDQNGVEKFNVSGHYFADSENSFISYYLLKCDLEYMKSKVLEAIYQLPENNRDIEIRESLEIDLIPRPHGISCMENKDITNQSSEDNIISQSQLKEKLVSVDKDSDLQITDVLSASLPTKRSLMKIFKLFFQSVDTRCVVNVQTTF